MKQPTPALTKCKYQKFPQSFSSNLVVLRVQSPDQQHQHPLETYQNSICYKPWAPPRPNESENFEAGPCNSCFFKQDFQLIVMHMKFRNHSSCFLESPWELAKTLIDRLHSQNRGPWCHRTYKFPNNCNCILSRLLLWKGKEGPTRPQLGRGQRYPPPETGHHLPDVQQAPYRPQKCPGDQSSWQQTWPGPCLLQHPSQGSLGCRETHSGHTCLGATHDLTDSHL